MGRCYERSALQTAALGIHNAFLNQPVEVAALRPTLSTHLGLEMQARLSGAIWPGPTDAAITAQAAGGGARLIRSAPLSPGGRGAGGEGESGTQRQILFDSEPPPLPNPLPPGERGKSRPHGSAKGLLTDKQTSYSASKT